MTGQADMTDSAASHGPRGWPMNDSGTSGVSRS
jgi:hypothetical protein